jgi:hypothetical protein
MGAIVVLLLHVVTLVVVVSAITTGTLGDVGRGLLGLGLGLVV